MQLRVYRTNLHRKYINQYSACYICLPTAGDWLSIWPFQQFDQHKNIEGQPLIHYTYLRADNYCNLYLRTH